MQYHTYHKYDKYGSHTIHVKDDAERDIKFFYEDFNPFEQYYFQARTNPISISLSLVGKMVWRDGQFHLKIIQTKKRNHDPTTQFRSHAQRGCVYTKTNYCKYI